MAGRRPVAFAGLVTMVCSLTPSRRVRVPYDIAMFGCVSAAWSPAENSNAPAMTRTRMSQTPIRCERRHRGLQLGDVLGAVVCQDGTGQAIANLIGAVAVINLAQWPGDAHAAASQPLQQ